MNPKDVKLALTLVEVLAGPDWLKQWTDRLKEMDDEGPARGRYAPVPAGKIPPLAYLWYRATEESALAELVPEAKLTVDMLRMSCMGRDLDLVRRQPGFAHWWPVFREGGNFPRDVHLLTVAAGLTRRGWQVEFAAPYNELDNEWLLNLSRSDIKACARCLSVADWHEAVAAINIGWPECDFNQPLFLYLDLSRIPGIGACLTAKMPLTNLPLNLSPAVVPWAVIFTVFVIHQAGKSMAVDFIHRSWWNPVRQPAIPLEIILPAGYASEEEKKSSHVK